MKRLLLNWCLLMIVVLKATSISLAQTGSYFITHYNPAENNYDNTNYALIQDDRGVMHFANRQGVLHFDGNSWWLSTTPYSIYCLADAGDIIYVGGREGFGMISKNADDESYYTAIDTVHRNINRCLITDTKVYFANDRHVFSFFLSNPGIIDTIYTTPEDILDFRAINGKLYLTYIGSPLQELVGKELKKTFIDTPEGTYFIRQSPSGKLLYYTEAKEIFINMNDSITNINFDNKDYITKLDVTEITWVSDAYIAISTLSGGIFMINAITGVTEQIVDYETGLPDNQVTTIAADKAGEMWAIHPFGLSVVSPLLPLRSFKHYPGLTGTLLMAITYKNELVVGTSTGIFKLVKKRKTKESVVYDRVRVAVNNSEVKEVIDKKRKKGLFKKRRKKKEEEAKLPAAKPSYKYVYRKRIIEEDLSISYAYEKIKGVNAKTVNILEYNNQLIAGTVHGLYAIREDSAYLIEEVPVLNIYGLPNENLLFVSTIDEEVRTLIFKNGRWQDLNMLEGLNDYIVQITLDPENNVWLCGADSLYRLEVKNHHLNDLEVYNFDNPHFDRIYSVNYEGQILFINTSGYYSYKDRSIIKNHEIEKAIGLPIKCVLGNEGQLLVNTGSNWYGANKDLRNTLNFLSLFKDPQYVANDSGQDFWVITASNDLYKISADKISTITSNETIYLKEVRDTDGKLSFDTELIVNQENSSLTFEFASPDYSGIYQKQYQYRLTNTGGTKSPWSPWSVTNNMVSYQFLPQGSYILEARFKNALGKVINASPFKFEVVPPYWKRPWFYMVELLFFGSLLMFSFHLNRGVGKYAFISRLLGFLTLILIVEFFQTVAEYKFETNDSPVINFFIQAFIALLILPVESVLRKWITTNPDDKEIIAKENVEEINKKP